MSSPSNSTSALIAYDSYSSEFEDSLPCQTPNLLPLNLRPDDPSSVKAYFMERREKYLAENAVLRERLRTLKGKIPVCRGEEMYDDAVDSIMTLSNSVCRLEYENEVLVVRVKRLEYMQEIKDYFCGTKEQLDQRLDSLGLLSPYDLSEGDEPDSPGTPSA